MKYIGYFSDYNNKEYKIEIITNNVTGQTKEIQLSGEPFSLETVSNGLYSNLKLHNATINIVNKDALFDLYSSTAKGTKVSVTSGDDVIFKGYATPVSYSQPYSNILEVIELQAVDGISILEYIKYQSFNRTIVSFKDILKKCLKACECDYRYLYYPYNFLIGSDSNAHLYLDRLSISELNFFDDDAENTAWSMKEVLEEMMKFLGMSLTVYNNDVYLIDYNYINNNQFNYHKYDIENDTELGMQQLNNVIDLTGKIASNDTNISLSETYNKVTVNCNLYPIESVIPNLNDESLLNPLIKESPYYVQRDGSQWSYFVKFYENLKFENVFTDRDSLQPIEVNLEQYSTNADDLINNHIGCLITKQAKYHWADGKPATLNFENVLAIGMGLGNKNYSDLTDLTMFLKQDIEVLKINPNYLVDTAILPSGTTTGYLVLSGQYFQSDSLYTDPKKGGDLNWNNANGDPCCKFKLKIGNKYWDGGKWTNEETRFIIDVGGYGKSKIWYEWNDFGNNVTYDMNLDATGYAIPIKASDGLFGKIEFSVLRPLPNSYGQGGRIYRYPYYTFLKNLSLKLYTGTAEQDGKDDTDNDVAYTNVINDDYVNEFDDIELKINTQTAQDFSYSSVFTNINDKYSYLDKVIYQGLNPANLDQQQELNLVQKYAEYYEKPRIILNTTINEDLNPSSRIYFPYLNKYFFFDSNKNNLRENQNEITIFEMK